MEPYVQSAVAVYGQGGFRRDTACAVRETPLRILAGGRELVRLSCMGVCPRELAVGHLFYCGLIRDVRDLISLEVDRSDDGLTARAVVAGPVPETNGHTVTSGLGRVAGTGAQSPESLAAPIAPGEPWIDPQLIARLAGELAARSDLYRLTRGCHNAALCSADGMLLFYSDIGRHNAIDMIVGRCLLGGIDPAGKLIVSSGRAASEIALKAVRFGVGVLAASAAATSLAVETARLYGLTLIGNAGPEAFTVYHDPGRIRGCDPFLAGAVQDA